MFSCIFDLFPFFKSCTLQCNNLLIAQIRGIQLYQNKHHKPVYSRGCPWASFFLITILISYFIYHYFYYHCYKFQPVYSRGFPWARWSCCCTSPSARSAVWTSPARSSPCPRSRPGTRSSCRGLYRLREKFVIYIRDFTCCLTN